MKILNLMGILGIIVLVISAASALDFSTWKQIEVDENLINSTSNTYFTVMIPPGYTNNTVDSPIGPVTNIVNESDPNAFLSIIVTDNPIGQKLNDTNSKDFLDKFMLGANITPTEGTEPQYLKDGGIVDYGTNGEEVGGVYILSTDEKVMVVSGFYKTIDDATAGTENLALIASTIDVPSLKTEDS